MCVSNPTVWLSWAILIKVKAHVDIPQGVFLRHQRTLHDIHSSTAFADFFANAFFPSFLLHLFTVDPVF